MLKGWELSNIFTFMNEIGFMKWLYHFSRELDAFIYDSTVLEYLVAQDEECKLLTVGAWAAMTGYGAAFPRNSKHFHNFNRKVMDYSENGKYRKVFKVCFL